MYNLLVSRCRDDNLEKNNAIFFTDVSHHPMEFFEAISERLNKENNRVTKIYLDFSSVHSATLFIKASWKN